MPKLSPEALKKARRGMFKGWPSDKDPRKLKPKVRPAVIRGSSDYRKKLFMKTGISLK